MAYAAPRAPVAPSSSGSGSAAFRSTRNDLAQTLQRATPIEARSSAGRAAASGLGLPAIQSAQPRTSLPSINNPGAQHARIASAGGSASKPQSAGPHPPSTSSPASASSFPSTDKEESKDGSGSSALAAASSSSSSSTKDKDWKLWNGAVEAQWILSVLDDITHKLTLSSLLTPDLLKDSKFLDTLDPELVLTLREHFQVENQYYEFLDSELWKNQAFEAKNQELFQELDLCLADSTRTVTRMMKACPQLVRRLREINGKRSNATLDFLNTFARLRGLIHAKLRMTAEEERDLREQLAELKVLEEEDTVKFIQMTERLAVERYEHEQSLSAKESKIERLNAQIAQLQLRTAQEKALFEEKMREDHESSEKAFKSAERDLLKQLESLTSQFEVDGAENFRGELLYHRKKNLRALDVTNLIDKYDTDMTLKHESVVDMEAVYAKERAELAALTGYFQVRDAEEARIAAEHQRIREDRDAELRVERRNQQAQLLTQGLFQQFYSKHGPKQPKAKKVKKKKDPFAGLRQIGRVKSAPATKPDPAAAGAAAATTAASAPGDSPSASPLASGAEETEGEQTADERA